MLLADLTSQTYTTVTKSDIGLGSVIAVVCSWQRNRSILWAILVGILSWFYVIYFALTREPAEIKLSPRHSVYQSAGSGDAPARLAVRT